MSALASIIGLALAGAIFYVGALNGDVYRNVGESDPFGRRWGYAPGDDHARPSLALGPVLLVWS